MNTLTKNNAEFDDLFNNNALPSLFICTKLDEPSLLNRSFTDFAPTLVRRNAKEEGRNIRRVGSNHLLSY